MGKKGRESHICRREARTRKVCCIIRAKSVLYILYDYRSFGVAACWCAAVLVLSLSCPSYPVCPCRRRHRAYDYIATTSWRELSKSGVRVRSGHQLVPQSMCPVSFKKRNADDPHYTYGRLRTPDAQYNHYSYNGKAEKNTLAQESEHMYTGGAVVEVTGDISRVAKRAKLFFSRLFGKQGVAAGEEGGS